jgi:BirA family biotin operon repressor/biotin-[acetyl-CoA-carboxylase] ligase
MSSTVFTGKVVREFESLASTNEFGHALIEKEKVVEGTVIRAAYQSGGKGYSGNSWESEAGKNLLVSIILKPVFLQPKRQFFLNQAISLAVAETVKEHVLAVDVKVKWPNDIFCDDRKVAGILIENSVQGNLILHSVVGIGLNVNQTVFSPVLKNVTSLRTETGNEFDLKTVLGILCEKIEYRYLQLKNNHIEEIQKDYMRELYRGEQECVFRSGGNRFNAKIAGLTAEGKLVLQLHDHHEVFGFKEVEMVM